MREKLCLVANVFRGGGGGEGGREDEGQPLGQGGQLTLRQDDNVVIHGGLHTILQS